jgi:hypothetical protein
MGSHPGSRKTLKSTTGGSARAIGAGRGCGDGATAGCGLIVGSVLEAPAVVSGFDNIAVMGEAIEQCGRHLGVCEDVWPG